MNQDLDMQVPYRCEQVHAAFKARPDIPELESLQNKALYLEYLCKTRGVWNDEVFAVFNEVQNSLLCLDDNVKRYIADTTSHMKIDFTSDQTVERLLELFDDQMRIRSDFRLWREDVTTPRHLVEMYYDSIALCVEVPRILSPDEYRLQVRETLSAAFESSHFSLIIERFPQEFGMPMIRMPSSIDSGRVQEQVEAINEQKRTAVVVVDEYENFEYPSMTLAMQFQEVNDVRRMVQFLLQAIHDSPRTLKK